MKYIILFLLLSSCGLKKVERVNSKFEERDFCKKNMKAEEYLSIPRPEKGAILDIMECALRNRDFSIFSFYRNKANRKMMTNTDQIKYLKMSGRYYLEIERYDLYKNLRKDFQSYKTDEFIKQELHYLLLFSYLDEAKALIKKNKGILRDTLYIAWYYYLLNDNKQSLKVLKDFKDKSHLQYKVLVAANLGRKLRVVNYSGLSILEKQSIEMLNAK